MNWRERIKSLGPGLLYAGAAIGVSHLVQSTKAGAMFGFGLLLAIVIANLVKYPFFEIGPRYAATVGKSLIHGYSKLGKWAVWLVLLITVSTMFTIQSAVTIVTAGLADQLFGIKMSGAVWSAIILTVCCLVLLLGKYTFLDGFIKGIMVLLAITTVVAFVLSFDQQSVKAAKLETFSFMENAHILFLVGLIGWMPAPLDISIWQSIWSVEKKKNQSFSLKTALFDFKVGFWGTLALAICFLALGANVLHGSGTELANSGGKFAQQLIVMYTSTIGDWAFFLIAIAAFSTMFSTTLTCLDAVPRVLKNLALNLNNGESKGVLTSYWFYILLISTGTLVVLSTMISSMGQMVKIATAISFLTAPLIALLNYLVIYKTDFDEKAKPNTLQKKFSVLGIALLFGFAIYYVYLLFV